MPLSLKALIWLRAAGYLHREEQAKEKLEWFKAGAELMKGLSLTLQDIRTINFSRLHFKDDLAAQNYIASLPSAKEYGEAEPTAAGRGFIVKDGEDWRKLL